MRASASSIRDSAKPDVHEHVVVRLDLGDVLEADALRDAAEVDLAHQDVVLVIGLNDSSRHCQDTSSHSLVRLPGRCDGELAQAEAAVVRGHATGAGTPGTPRHPAVPRPRPAAGHSGTPRRESTTASSPVAVSQPAADLRDRARPTVEWKRRPIDCGRDPAAYSPGRSQRSSAACRERARHRKPAWVVRLVGSRTR